MYESAVQRDADIAASARQPARILRAELITTAESLTEALFDRDDYAWVATVRTSTGRRMRATELPWLRAREIWLHAVDLGSGVAMADLPPDMIEMVIDDVTATFAPPDCPPAGWLTGRSGGAGIEATLNDHETMPPAAPCWL